MANTVFIIGNGFDLDLGLKASYSDFAKSEEWKNLVTNRQGIYKGGNASSSLVLYLEKTRVKQNWFNIEEEIHNYIVSHPQPSKKNVEIAMFDYDGIKFALCQYLRRISNSFCPDKKRKSYELFRRLSGSVIVSFNYTDSSKLCGLSESVKDFTYIHGSLYDEVVLGCDVYSNEIVNKPLSFLYKYNMLHDTNDLVKSLRNASEVIFFGHSVNEMDFCYFRDFFMKVSVPPQPYPKKFLTFITKDEKSLRNIKDNIRNQGINVTDMYCNLEVFDFILTDYVYDNGTEDAKKWNNLIERISRRH